MLMTIMSVASVSLWSDGRVWLCRPWRLLKSVTCLPILVIEVTPHDYRLTAATEPALPPRPWVVDHRDEIITVCKWVVAIGGISVMIIDGPFTLPGEKGLARR
jgi:hypothetical protein